MAGIVGNNTIGASSAAAGAFNVQCFVHASLVYTAAAGDVVTSMSVYHGDTVTGAMQMGVYTISGTTPVTRVGTVNITIPASIGWVTQSCSIALTAGTMYGTAIDYRTDSSTWKFHFGVGPGGTAMSTDGNIDLPATWGQVNTDTNMISMYMTVTGAATSGFFGLIGRP